MFLNTKGIVLAFKKTRTSFPEKTYMFLEKLVRLFQKTRTCFWKNSYVFFGDIMVIGGVRQRQ